ncbi:MAG: hypothetical protein ACT4PL_12220 [Phycisphaerales bacterium]
MLTAACLLAASCLLHIDDAPPSGGAQPEGAEPLLAWPALKDPSAFTVQVTPRAWYTSPSGRFKLPATGPGGRTVRVETLDLDAPRVSPYAEMQVRAGDFRFTFSGAAYEVDRGATVGSATQIGDIDLNPGDETDSSFEYSTFNLSIGYRFYEKDFGKDGGGSPGRTVLRIDGEAGVRLHDIDISVTSGAATASYDGFFGEIFLGGRVELQFARDFSVDLVLNGGGFSDSERSVTSLDGSIAFSWRPVEAIALQLGWRQLLFDFQDGEGDGEFEFTGGMAGLFAGVVLRF